ncbi:ABC transporter permease [Sutterella sp.]|uniref:ABC transporter permease n=1 Tax=Sutterella sp. TaxID=1981025 RepID=UPI0026E06F9D|nr:ABC transporter permease [Sutterella sp.]MDO5532043.1 ABC transporter permease [Sutterella sp.]
MAQFPIAMTPRPERARSFALLSPLIALLLTVLTGFILFAALGQDPWRALSIFFIAPLDSLRGWTEVGVKMTPLLLCAVGLVVCFKSNIWNIGAEGQLVVGAITGGIAALACDPSFGKWYVVVVMLASAAGGAVWGGITALLRHKFHANEILVSLMLVYVAQLLLAWCVQGPMRDPQGFGFPQTALFESGALLPVLSGTRLHLGALLALISAVGIWLLMDRMALGFQFKVSGMAPLAARYAGYHPGKLIWASMLISGALAGLAGGIEASGPLGQLTPNISPGYGFAAIIVAFVGRLSPLGCIPAAFVMALFYLGGELAQSRLGLPSSITGVYQGLLLFFILACDTMILYRLSWRGFSSARTKEGN